MNAILTTAVPELQIKEGRGKYRKATKQEIMEASSVIKFQSMIAEKKSVIASPQQSVDFLSTRLAYQEREVFGVLYLDNRHQVIDYEDLFFGTIDGASVHPREVVKGVLLRNAAAVIFAHNHPSGVTEPSPADLRITQRLKDALALIEVRVLDHVIIGDAGKYRSLAESNQI